MIQEANERLSKWAQDVLVGTSFSFAPPQRERVGKGISAYLFELADLPPLRSRKRPPLQLMLRYLVTVWADDLQEAHRMLGQLVFAAMEHTEFEVDLASPPAGMWEAFDVLPQPAFVLCVPLRLERPQPDVPLVLEPPILDDTPITQLNGLLLGPNDVPLAGAQVAYPALQRTTRTDPHGRFRFAAVPAGARTHRLHINARNRTRNVDVQLPEKAGETLVIHFDLFDEP